MDCTLTISELLKKRAEILQKEHPKALIQARLMGDHGELIINLEGDVGIEYIESEASIRRRMEGGIPFERCDDYQHFGVVLPESSIEQFKTSIPYQKLSRGPRINVYAYELTITEIR
jgi:hypothetical protein